MPVLFSRACEYAIQGLVEMARHPEQKYWRIQDLAERTNTPAPFLAKTFQILAKNRMLNSTKGRGGGFSFAIAPKDISLLDVVTMVDGFGLTENCVLGFKECGGHNPCEVHEEWGMLREKILDTLRKKTLANSAG